MTKILLTTILTTILLSCSNLEPLEKRELTEKNPTEHIFNMPLVGLKKTILSIFNERKYLSKRYRDSTIFYFNVGSGDKLRKMPVSFSVETSDDPVFGKDFFKNQGTRNDIYLHSFGEPWPSLIYYADGKQLNFRTPFILTLVAVDREKTLLKVRPEDPKVIKGIGGIGPHGFQSKDISVEPTTIEEYSLILLIGQELGDTTLRPLNLKTKD